MDAIRKTAFILLSLCAAEPGLASVRNDLEGSLHGQVMFAQTHVVQAQRRLFDPFLVPHKPALIMFEPSVSMANVELVVTLDDQAHTFRMNPPVDLPSPARFDQENTFSGRPIEGTYPPFRTSAFSVQVPWDLFVPRARIGFQSAGDPALSGTLPADRFLFMAPESEGLALVNIKGCIFKPRATCDVSLDQYDGEQHLALAKIAAREMLSELPVPRLSLGTGKAYWPTVVAIDPNGRPHVYDLTDAANWAEFGDKTLPAKLGMGSYWRAASGLGDKKPGQFVAISGQLLDAPAGIPLLPPGVGASCGGNSCNYPNRPVGYWHETGHGLGLPHDTPGRYEDWAYRAYDNVFLPNTHPDPARYGLAVDHLGWHYFGHVLGSLATGSWPAGTASAPLITEFETFREWNPEALAWQHYIAPYTHQQTLRVQERFGTLPDVAYASVGDDLRDPPAPPALSPGASDARALNPDPALGADERPATATTGTPLVPVVPSEPVATGVPVHTLVATFSDPSHNLDGVNQLYPAILSNYGNVFPLQAPDTPVEPAPIPRTGVRESAPGVRFATAAMTCMDSRGDGILQGSCDSPGSRFSATVVPPVSEEEEGFKPIVLLERASGGCLSDTLVFIACDTANDRLRWRTRLDLSHNENIYHLQERRAGKFITAQPDGSFTLEAHSPESTLKRLSPSEQPYAYDVAITYADNSTEQHRLYRGFVVKDELLSAAFNVDSRRGPLEATLLVDGVAVYHRALEVNDLPAAIEVGAEHSEVGTLITDAGPLRWLRSVNTGKCIVPGSYEVRLGECNGNALWHTFNKPGSQPDSTLIVDGMGNCLQSDLSVRSCNQRDTTVTWWRREDLTGSDTRTNLQEQAKGLFVTATGIGDFLDLKPVSGDWQQLFDWSTPAFVTLKVASLAMCLVEERNTLRMAGCDQPTAQWRLVRDRPEDATSLFMLISPSGRCVDNDLRLQACHQPVSAGQKWRPRKDLAPKEGTTRLQQNRLLPPSRFAQGNADGNVSLEAFDVSQQVFEVIPESHTKPPCTTKTGAMR